MADRYRVEVVGRFVDPAENRFKLVAPDGWSVTGLLPAGFRARLDALAAALNRLPVLEAALDELRKAATEYAYVCDCEAPMVGVGRLLKACEEADAALGEPAERTE